MIPSKPEIASAIGFDRHGRWAYSSPQNHIPRAFRCGSGNRTCISPRMKVCTETCLDTYNIRLNPATRGETARIPFTPKTLRASSKVQPFHARLRSSISHPYFLSPLLIPHHLYFLSAPHVKTPTFPVNSPVLPPLQPPILALLSLCILPLDYPPTPGPVLCKG